MTEHKTHILITGALGFLGKTLARELKKSGRYRVMGLDIHENFKSEDDLPEGMSCYISSKLSSASEITTLLEAYQVEAVFHLAGSADPALAHEVNFSTTERLINAITEYQNTNSLKVKMLITSSSSIYGFQKNPDAPVTEVQTLNPITEYGKTKAEADHLCQRTTGIDIQIARLFNLVGPGQSTKMFCPGLAQKFFKAALNPNQTIIEVEHLLTVRDFVDVRDVAAAITHIFENAPRSCIINICSGVATPIQRVFDILSKIFFDKTGRKLQPLAEKEKLDLTDLPYQVGSNQKLRELTGFTPRISIETSLIDLFEEMEKS